MVENGYSAFEDLNIAFRVDASVAIGTGHVVRCYTLAEALRLQGANVRFVCADLSGHMAEWLAKKNIPISLIRSASDQLEDAELTRQALASASFNADWMVVDHYALDAEWEACFASSGVFVIDDLADRSHRCDVLLDQNDSEMMDSRYLALVPKSCRCLLGPGYALLRPEFSLARQSLLESENGGIRSGVLNHVFVFLSGSDPQNQTLKCLQALTALGREDWRIDVVIGGVNPYRSEIESYCKQYPFIALHCQVDNIAALMAKADLAIAGGGVNTWERLALGLPSIVLLLADNQVALSESVAKRGLIVNLGRAEHVSARDIQGAVARFQQQPETLRKMSRDALSFMRADGLSAILRAFAGSVQQRLVPVPVPEI